MFNNKDLLQSQDGVIFVLFLFYFRNSLNHSVLSCAVDPISQHVTLQSNIMTKEEIWEISITVTKKL